MVPTITNENLILVHSGHYPQTMRSVIKAKGKFPSAKLFQGRPMQASAIQ